MIEITMLCLDVLQCKTFELTRASIFLTFLVMQYFGFAAFSIYFCPFVGEAFGHLKCDSHTPSGKNGIRKAPLDENINNKHSLNKS